MTGRIIPNWKEIDQFKSPLTEGERHLIHYLDKYLPKDQHWQEGGRLEEYQGWLIFVQPYLNGSRPDIVVFKPKIGMMIIEVKDWHLRHYHWNDNKKICVKDGRGSYPIKSPIKQVEHYKSKIIGLLIPEIGEVNDRVGKSYGMIKTGVYFHNAKNTEVQDLFGKRHKNQNNTPLFGRVELHKHIISTIVPDVYLGRSRQWQDKSISL